MRSNERSSVVPQVAIRRKSLRDRLRHLSVVFKVAIRLKIAKELYARPMSPTEFAEEFGGGTPARIAQNCAELEKHGWLRRVGYKERTAKQRGQSEVIYRATELPFFDAETWALLPYSLRLAYSWTCFTATAQELRLAIEGAFFDGRASRDLTCVTLELDEIGWRRVIAELDAHFEAIFEEQEDSRIRIARGRAGVEMEAPFRAGILQMGFELPRNQDRLGVGLADGSAESLAPIPERMAPILADELCMEILDELNRSDMSVKRFHQEFAGETSERSVRHRFDRLKDLAWITVIDQIPKGGSFEKIYRATKPSVSSKNGPWADVPSKLEETETWSTFVRFSDLFKEAILAGTLDLRDDRHFSWTTVNLDREGWEKVVPRLDRLDLLLDQEQRRSRKRIAAGAKPLAMAVALMASELPESRSKVP
jgi:DNA-binding HxlR family transcriptional regulator